MCKEVLKHGNTIFRLFILLSPLDLVNLFALKLVNLHVQCDQKQCMSAYMVMIETVPENDLW